MRTMGDEVHSHNSSYIYNIENQMETLSSSPYQLGLGGWLSHLRLSHYIFGIVSQCKLKCYYKMNEWDGLT